MSWKNPFNNFTLYAQGDYFVFPLSAHASSSFTYCLAPLFLHTSKPKEFFTIVFANYPILQIVVEVSLSVIIIFKQLSFWKIVLAIFIWIKFNGEKLCARRNRRNRTWRAKASLACIKHNSGCETESGKSQSMNFLNY